MPLMLLKVEIKISDLLIYLHVGILSETSGYVRFIVSELSAEKIRSIHFLTSCVIIDCSNGRDHRHVHH